MYTTGCCRRTPAAFFPCALSKKIPFSISQKNRDHHQKNIAGLSPGIKQQAKDQKDQILQPKRHQKITNQVPRQKNNIKKEYSKIPYYKLSSTSASADGYCFKSCSLKYPIVSLFPKADTTYSSPTPYTINSSGKPHIH